MSAEIEDDEVDFSDDLRTPQQGTTLGQVALGGTLGAAVAALGFLAYRYYEGYKLKNAAEPVFPN